MLVEPSVQQSTTDAQGRARMVVTAPPPPAFLPTSAATLTITATPIDGDALSTDNSRTVMVQLVPPAGTLPPNRLPVASFTVVPAVGTIMETITFDASLTTDEGEPCGSLCTYQWNFGDFQTASGIRVSHSFERPGTYTVVLTVVDPRGGVGSTNRSAGHLRANGASRVVHRHGFRFDGGVQRRRVIGGRRRHDRQNGSGTSVTAHGGYDGAGREPYLPLRGRA